MPGLCQRIGIVLLAVATVGFVACDGDDELKPNPSQGGGGAPPPSGGSSGGSSDDDEMGSDAWGDTGADASFDREACRQQFIDLAVDNTAWYHLQCQQPAETNDAGAVRDCRAGSPATERFLQFKEDGTYWFNVVHYDDYDNKQNWGGWCRDPAVRNGEVYWRMIDCNRVKLWTGCGWTEEAWLTEQGLVFDTKQGTIQMSSAWPDELRAGRMRNPLGPTGCWDDAPTAEPMCGDY